MPHEHSDCVDLTRLSGQRLGEFFFELHADYATSVIDMLAGPDEDNLVCFPTRVVSTPAGGSAFTFTMFQAPGQPDEQFASQHSSLLRELGNLERRFRGSSDGDPLVVTQPVSKEEKDG